MENQKTKAKNYYQGKKEKLQERSREYYRYLPEDEKIKKRNYPNNGNKNMSEKERGRKKEYMRNHYYERKNLLNHVINCVEELENVSLNKENFK